MFNIGDDTTHFVRDHNKPHKDPLKQPVFHGMSRVLLPLPIFKEPSLNDTDWEISATKILAE